MTIDDFLLDLDPARRRRRLRAEADSPEPPKPKPVDADQGHRGTPLEVEKKTSPDAWLMAVRDEGKYGPDGVESDDYYVENY